jgi:predicted SnoaL-like aldol condensation-catalyzing enzyme
MNYSKKDQVVSLLKCFETRDPSAIDHIHPKKYRRHNPMESDGLLGFASRMLKQDAKTVKVNPIRVLQDGDFVIAHSQFQWQQPTVGLDIFRFSGNKIVEHWENHQLAPSKSEKHKNLIEGSTTVKDESKTNDNKDVAKRFAEEILLQQKYHLMGDLVDLKNYVVRSGLVHAKTKGAAAASRMVDSIKKNRYVRVHRILGEGNFIVLVCEGYIKNAHYSFCELLNIEHSKIIEHWQVATEIPPRERWLNKNGQF